MTPKFQIGQKVWRAIYDSQESSVECPDCAGTARIRCLLPDDTMVSIECEGCKLGFNPPTGRVMTYDRTPRAELGEIFGLEIYANKIEYRVRPSWIVAEEFLFDNEADALAKAARMVEDVARKELARIQSKEKPTKSWSWHVHYHRSCIRRAEKDIAYHTAKLNAARAKAKEPVE